MKQSVQVEFKFWGQALGTPETLCSEAINLLLEIVPQRAYQEQQS